MKFCKYIIILPLLCWAFDLKAQEPQELSSMPEQWQLTLDMIKSKAQTLVVENNGLQVEYRQLIGQVQELQQSIKAQQYKNEQLQSFLKKRHGRTDQQILIEGLNKALNIKRQKAIILDQQLGNLNRKQSDLNNKVQQLKTTVLDLQRRQQVEEQKAKAAKNQVQAPVDDQLPKWRKQFEDESKQEALLENEMASLKLGGKTQNLKVDAIVAQNKELEAQLDVLRSQNSRYDKKSADAQLMQASRRMYDKLKMRKDQLEASIYAYEMRMDDLKQSTLMTLSWTLRRKKLIHEMIEADARDNKMRDTIKVLREDIDVLRDQVARLERRLDFAKDQGTKQ